MVRAYQYTQLTMSSAPVLEKKPVKFSNLLLGAGLNLFEVTTLGQPLEVTKTTMAANRGDSMAGAVTRIMGRGGVFGCKYPSNPLCATCANVLKSTKVSFHGLGLKPPPRAPSSSSSRPRPNTMLVPLARVTSRRESAVVSWVVLRRLMPRWVSALA